MEKLVKCGTDFIDDGVNSELSEYANRDYYERTFEDNVRDLKLLYLDAINTWWDPTWTNALMFIPGINIVACIAYIAHIACIACIACLSCLSFLSCLS